jgi:hypothetical protein
LMEKGPYAAIFVAVNGRLLLEKLPPFISISSHVIAVLTVTAGPYTVKTDVNGTACVQATAPVP